MKLAFIILAHKNPRQVVRLIDALNVPRATSFFIHVDKKVAASVCQELTNNLAAYPNVRFVERYNSAYASFGLVEATMAGLTAAIESDFDFDYLINLSGQDYPIKTFEQIRAKLGERPNFSYVWHHELPFVGTHPTKGVVCQKLNRIEFWHLRIKNRDYRFPLGGKRYRRVFSIRNSVLWRSINLFLPEKRPFLKNFVPHGGGQWWCLSRRHAEYVYNFVRENKRAYRFFKYTNIPDEIFFQTVLLNSPHKNEIVNDDLRMLYFAGDSSHPITYYSSDFPQIARSPQLFARKFDAAADETVLDLIDRQLLQNAAASLEIAESAARAAASRS